MKYIVHFSSRRRCYYLTNGDVTAFVLSSKLRQGNNNATDAAIFSSLVSAVQRRQLPTVAFPGSEPVHDRAA